MRQNTDPKLEACSSSPATNRPVGRHPVVIAAGAAAGAFVGATIGTVLGGPFGALAGCAMCAAIGALFGQGIGDNLRPAAEEMYSMRSGSRVILSSAYGRPSEALAVAPSAPSSPMRVRPPIGSGSCLAVSGLRFPARSDHNKATR